MSVENRDQAIARAFICYKLQKKTNCIFILQKYGKF